MLLTACTHNDGDVGVLHGMWRVTAIEVDGEKLNDYSGTLYFEFQTGVHCQKLVNEQTYECEDQYASWRYQNEKEIIIDFCDNRYRPIEITKMQMGQNLLQMEKVKGNSVDMLYVAPNGVEYRYKLKKW